MSTANLNNQHIGLFGQMEEVIARRPEWRFLKQQRHLKDIIRLLLRDVETYSQSLDTHLWQDEELRYKALTLSWFALLMSQELQHPPQLTRQIFNYVFYQTFLNSGHHQIGGLNKPPTNDIEQVDLLQQQMFYFVQSIFRLQDTYIGWNKPWYRICHFMPFLSHLVPRHWINQFQEMLLLLQQHDSLLGTSAHEPAPPNLHASHPLQKKALVELQNLQQTYSQLDQDLTSNQESLQVLFKKMSTKVPSVQLMPLYFSQMQWAWQQSKLLHATKHTQHQRLQLFEEAEFCRRHIANLMKDVLNRLHDEEFEIFETEKALIQRAFRKV